MIEIFYKSKGRILSSADMVFLNELGFDDVLWIDLFEPTGEEKRSVEEFLETTLRMVKSTLRELNKFRHISI